MKQFLPYFFVQVLNYIILDVGKFINWSDYKVYKIDGYFGSVIQ